MGNPMVQHTAGFFPATSHCGVKAGRSPDISSGREGDAKEKEKESDGDVKRRPKRKHGEKRVGGKSDFSFLLGSLTLDLLHCSSSLWKKEGKKRTMSSQSLAALRAYVCAPGQAGGANQAESTVRLNVEHVALKATRFAELRLDKHVREEHQVFS